MSLGLLILGLFLFIMLVVVHEFGHFIVAKRNGVKVEEFGIFFPPKLWQRKTKQGWVFSINLLPLGGFVRLKGEHDADTGPHTYGGATLGVKTKILLAGVGMNLLAAFVLLTALTWLGLPQLVPNQFIIKSDSHYIERGNTTVVLTGIQPNSPAAKIGLKKNETLTSIGVGQHITQITNPTQLLNLVTQYAGKTVVLGYKEGTQQFQQSVTLRSSVVVKAYNAAHPNNPEGYVGVEDNQQQKGITLTRSTWSGPIVAGGVMVQYTALTIHGIGTAVRGLGAAIAGLATGNKPAREAGQSQAANQVLGPYGIFELLKNDSVFGYQFVLMIVAVISLSLAIVNILPIPALDGGKLYLTALFRLLRRTLTESMESLIYGASFLVLITLVVLITIADVQKF
jgi:regulator of sigma E protease